MAMILPFRAPGLVLESPRARRAFPVARWLRGLVSAIRNRRAAMDLAGLDDRQLRDIGLTRRDVTGALDLPFDRDPTLHLAELSGRRPPRR